MVKIKTKYFCLKGMMFAMQFSRFLPEKPLIENEKFVIYGNDDLEGIVKDLMDYLLEKRAFLLDFFSLETFKRVEINLFNSQEVYLDFVKQFYEPSPYSRGNFIGDMINHTYDIDQISKVKRYLFHELVHIFYASIWEGKYDRILWLDEGLALYLSGERSLLESNVKKFKAWYLDRIIRYDKEIPRIEFLKKHGGTYGKFVDLESNKYDGYDFSYLIVRYIVENFNDLIGLLSDIKKIRSLETGVIKKCIDYYNVFFQVDRIKESFDDVSTPDELMDYMNRYIVYGWLDNQGNRHVENLKEFRRNYRISSLEEILSSKLGTCIEQAKLIKFFFDRIGLENKLFCFRRYEKEENFDKEVKMHCFVLFKYQDRWYHFEHSNSNKRGIHEFDSIQSAIDSVVGKYDESDIRELVEIPQIPEGLSFKEFNLYVNTFDPIPIYEAKKKI